MIVLMLLLLLRSSLCEDTATAVKRKFPQNTADISSINNLAYKPPFALDPKIRKALLNVLNRLEEQERSEDIDFKIVPEKLEDKPNQQRDNVKWEYKTNDTAFKEYNYNQIVDDKHKNKYVAVDEEPGALFFQLPGNEADDEKHESLNLQESKNPLNNDYVTSNDKLEAVTTNASTNSSKKSFVSENDVEVFQAPLLTAFTLEHDERGLPRRIIPLNTAEYNSIVDNKILVDSSEPRKAREQSRVAENAQSPQSEQKRYQLELQSQLQELLERKRQLDVERQKFLVEQENARRLEQENARSVKQAQEFRQREEILRSIGLQQNEIPRQEVSFQKSIPLDVIGRNQPILVVPQTQFRLPVPPPPLSSPQIGLPDHVDRQLQNLFQRSGITQQEDLNIVTKVLALNYEDNNVIKTDRPPRVIRNEELVQRTQKNKS